MNDKRLLYDIEMMKRESYLEQFNFLFITLFNIVYLPFNPTIAAVRIRVIVVVFVAGDTCE